MRPIQAATSTGARVGAGMRASRVYDAMKRASAADRPPITSSPRLNGRERVVDLVTQNAQQPLPRTALLITQRATQIGENQKPMRAPALSKSRPAQLPSILTRHELA